MSGTLAVYGAIGGVAVGAAVVTIGTRAVLAAAVNDEQRHALRQIFALSGFWAGAVMSIILLTAFQVLAVWAYAVALVLWFGPLLPALAWAHQRLDAVAGRAGFATVLSAA